MNLVIAYWNQVDVFMLRLKQFFKHAAILAKSLRPTVTAVTVTPTQLEATSFQKYVDITITDKSQSLVFYDTLTIQAAPYNNFIHPFDKTTCTNGVPLDNMLPEAEIATSRVLYSKLCQKDTIYEKYTAARN